MIETNSKQAAIEAYNNMLSNAESVKDYTSSVFGISQYDGWRTVSLNNYYLTLEKNPGIYLLYNKQERYILTESEGIELVNRFGKCK